MARPAELRNRLQRVFETGEPLDCFRHRRGIHAGKRSDRGRREDIRDQMTAQQTDRGERHERRVPFGRTPDDRIPVHEHS